MEPDLLAQLRSMVDARLEDVESAESVARRVVRGEPNLEVPTPAGRASRWAILALLTAIAVSFIIVGFIAMAGEILPSSDAVTEPGALESVERPAPIDVASTTEEYRAALVHVAGVLDNRIVLTYGQSEGRVWVASATGADYTDVGDANDVPWFVAASRSTSNLYAIGDEDRSLYVGSVEQMRLLANDVLSAAWHMFDNDRIAWTSSQGEVTNLFRAEVSDGDPVAVTVSSSLPAGSRVYGYSNEGFLIGNGSGLTAVSPEGDELRRLDREFHALAEDGTVIVRRLDGAFERTSFTLEKVEPVYTPSEDMALVQIRWLSTHGVYAVAAKTISNGDFQSIIRTIDTAGETIDEIEVEAAFNRMVSYDDSLVVAGVEDDQAAGRLHALVLLSVEPLRVTEQYRFNNWIFPVAPAPGR